jgi:signal transducing adaptor molecule
VDDEIRRKEEEELQRVLEMSMQDKGGRDQWSAYSSSGAGGSGSGAGSSTNRVASGSYTSTANGYQAASTTATSTPSYSQQPTYNAGYAPAAAQVRSPSPEVQVPQSPTPSQTASTIITRVKALHTFEPTEPGELAFEKGDIIKVVDRGYKDWWRGQLKGRTGIFPVNYVEPLPEPTAAELAREAEQEAAVFAQAVNVEKLLTMLRALDPAKDNLADNEEIQELYRSSMALRPKIVKLIDKYSQKRGMFTSLRVYPCYYPDINFNFQRIWYP